MNNGTLIDIALVVVLIISLFRGWKIGFIQQLFSGVGFFGGLFLGSLIEPHFINLAHSVESRTLVALLCTLGMAFIFLTIGEFIGIHLKNIGLHSKIINSFDNILGSIISLVISLLIIWLIAIVLSSLSIPGLQSIINSSKIITTLNNNLPNAPTVLSDLGSIINPNGFPKVFLGGEPNLNNNNASLPSLSKFQVAISQDQNSVVKIEGLGCGGLVEGSGFVIGPNLVATNAHVIAGVNKIFVYDNNGSTRATPIYFNPNLDFAILRLSNLTDKPLVIDSNTLNNDSPTAFLGYPGGGPLSIKPSLVLAEIQAYGLNIFGQGNTSRSVYELKADVMPGNSGGPLINQQGQVVGIIFAKSTSYNNVGYALSANQIVKPLEYALKYPSKVTSNQCAE
ncbi:MAG: MarP family serine protease [Patescibacteria group bacterium]|jgi:S1-C subfamily serine protease|nr:MarP family serine protease [Patescibacteria group bacterium]